METTVQQAVDPELVRKAVEYMITSFKIDESAAPPYKRLPKGLWVYFSPSESPSERAPISIPLPHGSRSNRGRICLVVQEEPDMSDEETVEFYRNLLKEHQIKRKVEIVLPKNVKRDKGDFVIDECFIDSRIFSDHPSFLKRRMHRKPPIPLDLKSKDLAAELKQLMQIEPYKVIKRAHAVHIGDMHMDLEDIVENILAAAEVLAEKVRMNLKSIKSLHLKSASTALVIYKEFTFQPDESGLTKRQRRRKRKQMSREAEDGPPPPKKLSSNERRKLTNQQIKKKLEKKKKWIKKYHIKHIPLHAKKKKGTSTPQEEENGESTGKKTPPKVPNPKPTAKNKKTDVQKESKVVEKSKGPQKKVQVSSPKSPAPQKSKMNGKAEGKKQNPSNQKNSKTAAV